MRKMRNKLYKLTYTNNRYDVKSKKICDGYTTVINLQTTCLFFSSCNFKIVGICRNGICIRSDEINGNLGKHEKM